MNIRIQPVGIIYLLASLITAGGMAISPPLILAAEEKPHVCQGHDKQIEAPLVQKVEEDFFAELEEDGHKDPVVKSEHVDHDDHAGHNHEKKPSDHAGHDHGGDGDNGEICPEHQVLEEEDALCHSDHISELQPGQGMKVRLASLEVAAKAGVSVIRPKLISTAEGIAMPARVEFNRNRLVHITPLAAGVVRQVKVQPGEKVNEGTVLAEVAMLEIATLKAELLTALARRKQTEAAYHREKDLLERGISSRQEFQLAESEYHASRGASDQYRQQLQNYGLSPDNIEDIIRHNDTSAVVPFRAPFSGTVVEVKTALGEAVSPASPLFIVADLDSLWIELSVPESRVYLAQNQSPIEARFDGLPGMIFNGHIFQVGSIINERTRTLKVLGLVENKDHHLKVGMFGNVRILKGNEKQVLAVPADAVQGIDGDSYVFVQQEADLFELRRVQTGTKVDGMIPVLAGLTQDELVVASQGFSLKSEVLKARLGASCADH